MDRLREGGNQRMFFFLLTIIAFFKSSSYLRKNPGISPNDRSGCSKYILGESLSLTVDRYFSLLSVMLTTFQIHVTTQALVFSHANQTDKVGLLILAKTGHRLGLTELRFDLVFRVRRHVATKLPNASCGYLVLLIIHQSTSISGSHDGRGHWSEL
ncbi:hypothetical protein V8F06_014793 [Rhypophila decipiens]